MPMKHANCVGKTCALVQTKMHECSLCKPKCTSEVCVNQRCARTVCANHDAHGSRLMSRVYMCALNMYFHVIDLSCTHRLCCEYFQKLVKSCSCLMLM